MVPAGSRWLPDGRGGVRWELERGFPRRECGRESGCKDAFDQLLFPRVPLRYALPGALVGADALIGPLHQLPSTAKPAAAKREAIQCDDHPDEVGTIRHGTAVTKIAEEHSVPDGQLKSALAPIRRPPSRAEGHCTGARLAPFSLPPGAAHSLFGQDQKENGGAPPWEQPPGGSQTPVAAVRRPAISPLHFPIIFQIKEGTQSWIRF